MIAAQPSRSGVAKSFAQFFPGMAESIASTQAFLRSATCAWTPAIPTGRRVAISTMDALPTQNFPPSRPDWSIRSRAGFRFRAVQSFDRVQKGETFNRALVFNIPFSQASAVHVPRHGSKARRDRAVCARRQEQAAIVGKHSSMPTSGLSEKSSPARFRKSFNPALRMPQPFASRPEILQ